MFTVRSLHISLEVWGSILCGIILVCLIIGEGFNKNKKRIMISMIGCTMLLLIMDAFAWDFRGNTGVAAYYMVRISNFCVFVLSDILVMLYHTYVCNKVYPKENRRKKCNIIISSVYVIETIGILLIIISQFNHMYYYFDGMNTYHRGLLHPLSLVIGLAGGVIDMCILLANRNKLSRVSIAAMLSYGILPIISSIILIFYYGVSLVNISITISMIFMYIASIAEQSEIIKQHEKEIYDMKVAVMVSQIGPHFIYNTLSTIKHLCRVNPQLAAQTVDEFAAYLRGNIESLTGNGCIPFSQELEHVENYLAIEKKRFSDRVEVQYAIEAEDFLIPPLSLQPLVENAVKHGIIKREEGGSISIASQYKDGRYIIEISDNGVGFDTSHKKEDGRKHIGIQNVRDRIKEMCNGSVTVDSVPGEGTKVTIVIPAKGNKYENIGSR